MNSTTWLDYYQQNRLNRPEPQWHLPPPEDSPALRELARSLSHFQLGESGEGTFLLHQAQRTYADDPAYCAALALFIQEEQEHARLLQKLVERCRGRLVTNHWTHSLFRGIRAELFAHVISGQRNFLAELGERSEPDAALRGARGFSASSARRVRARASPRPAR